MINCNIYAVLVINGYLWQHITSFTETSTKQKTKEIYKRSFNYLFEEFEGDIRHDVSYYIM